MCDRIASSAVGSPVIGSEDSSDIAASSRKRSTVTSGSWHAASNRSTFSLNLERTSASPGNWLCVSKSRAASASAVTSCKRRARCSGGNSAMAPSAPLSAASKCTSARSSYAVPARIVKSFSRRMSVFRRTVARAAESGAKKRSRLSPHCRTVNQESPGSELSKALFARAIPPVKVSKITSAVDRARNPTRMVILVFMLASVGTCAARLAKTDARGRRARDHSSAIGRECSIGPPAV